MSISEMRLSIGGFRDGALVLETNFPVGMSGDLLAFQYAEGAMDYEDPQWVKQRESLEYICAVFNKAREQGIVP